MLDVLHLGAGDSKFRAAAALVEVVAGHQGGEVDVAEQLTDALHEHG